MIVTIVKDKYEGGKKAFELIKKGVADGAKVLGLATGSTPITLYDQMVESDVDFTNITSINLDEYYGLDPQNSQSYHYFMKKHLFEKKPFYKTYIPNGKAKDINQEIADYDKIISDNPIDIQILGIGGNGHIAFNEPGTPFDSTTHEVTLASSTIKANSRFFDNQDDVPKRAICMGIKSIMSAKQIILMAYGAAKQDAVKAMVEGPVAETVPASVLQKHPNVVVIVDRDAAAKLS